jgi:hypothetical protein
MKVEVNKDSNLLVILGEMTKPCQPLDAVINWPFKVTFQLVDEKHKA